jgi:hypothetical protein
MSTIEQIIYDIKKNKWKDDNKVLVRIYAYQNEKSMGRGILKVLKGKKNANLEVSKNILNTKFKERLSNNVWKNLSSAYLQYKKS